MRLRRHRGLFRFPIKIELVARGRDGDEEGGGHVRPHAQDGGGAESLFGITQE